MMLDQDERKTGAEDEPDAVLAELVERFVDQLQAGEPVDSQAFAAEHPEHAGALLELLPAAATMARLRASSLRIEEPAAHVRLDSDEIGGYRIAREIGRGGMGVVYEAEQLATGRKVALKVLPHSSAMDPRQVERFRIEGRATAALDHPHIIPVLEIGRERGLHFHVMPFVEGCSLATLIHEARSGPAMSILSHREAARLALQAAEALAHAHDLGIVHRDVKPANLLVEPEGHLWVADFGLARFLDGGDLTQTGDVIGTIRYLSPEQARGRRRIDARTDVYSLGVTLYELTTLRPAFDGHDRQDLLRRIASDEPIPPRRLAPTLPRDLETILSTAMAKAVDDRYGSAAEFAEDLRRFLDSRPILAKRPDVATRVARWTRRNRVYVAIATAVLALFLIGSAIGVALLWREQVRTRENLRLALVALDEFCLSTTGLDLSRDPERTQEVQDLQLKAVTIYERMLLQNPDDPETRWAAARAEHRVGNMLAQSPRFAEAEPAYKAAHQNLNLLLAGDPERLDYRRESADLLGDWGGAKIVGGKDTKRLRRMALDEHRKLASEFPDEPKYARAIGRDCIEVARTIGITIPAEAVEKEALFREAVALRRGLEDRSFEGKAELAEASAFLGHLLNATNRRDEGERVMVRGRDLLASLASESSGDPARRRRVVALEDLFSMPRYCEPSPIEDDTLAIHRRSLADKARLADEFPHLPEFRASLAWSHHVLAGTLKKFGRGTEAEDHERRAISMFEDLIRDHPSVDYYRRWANRAFLSLSLMIAGSGRDGEARNLARRASELIIEGQRLRDQRPGPVATSPGDYLTSKPR